MSTAPHLPDKKESDTNSRVGWLFLVVILAGLSGVAAALSTIAWLSPNLINTTTNRIAIESNKSTQEKKIDSLTKEQVDQRTVDIYNKRDKIENKYYRDEVLSQGVVLSSDGWVVTYRPNYRAGDYGSWEAVDYRGVVHEIEESVYDSKSGMLYLHLKGDNFRVSSIADWGELEASDTLWSTEDWDKHVLRKKQKLNPQEVYEIKDPIYYFKINREEENTSIVVNNSGDMVGFVDSSGRVVPSWYVSEHMNGVLGEGKLSYAFPDIQGIIINRFSREDNRTEAKTGFYITQTDSDQLKRGDVIMSINGKKIKAEDLAEQVITTDLPINLKVLSQEKTKQVQITN